MRRPLGLYFPAWPHAAMLLREPFVSEEREYWTNPNGLRDVTRQIVVHHAAAFYSPGKAVAEIYKFHSSKWPDYHAIAYHEVIQIEADRETLGCHITNPPDLIGAGVFGRNDDTFHVCAATNFTAIPSDEWIEALARRCVAAKQRYPDAVIVGHKDIALKGHKTDCPGQLWTAWKLRLLGRVSALQLATRPRRFKVRGLPIYQAQSLTSTLAGHLKSGEEFAIDKTYANGGAHLSDGRGFIDLSHDALEELS